MRWPSGIALVAALALTTPVAAQIPVSPLGDIYESYNDCFKVATNDGLKPELLGSLGWSRATTTSKDGKPVADAPILYGNAKRKPLILLTAEKGKGLCIVMARLENAKAFEDFKSAFGGKLPPPDNEGVIYFSADGHIIRLQQTGSPQEPSMTIGVMTPSEKK